MTLGVLDGTREGRARNAIELTGPAVTKNVRYLAIERDDVTAGVLQIVCAYLNVLPSCDLRLIAVPGPTT